MPLPRSPPTVWLRRGPHPTPTPGSPAHRVWQVFRNGAGMDAQTRNERPRHPITEHLPWDAENPRRALARLPLLNQGHNNTQRTGWHVALADRPMGAAPRYGTGKPT